MITKVFKSGNSKAVRIPASIELSGSEVEIVDLGKKGILLKPLSRPCDPWASFREGIDELGGAWPDRVQEPDQDRREW